MSKFYMIPNTKNLEDFKEELILPLEGYSIGFDVYFTSEEIENIAKNRGVNVIINSFLHKEKINKIKDEIDKMKNVKLFIVEDLGLLNIIERSRIVLGQNHIINNYKSINYFKELNIKNVVVSNELTIEELTTIKEKTNSNLFYFLINRNMLMYSKRKLLSSYYEHKGISTNDYKKEIIESVSRKKLIIKEENGSTAIFDSNIFSTNEYIDKLQGFNFIINFNNLNDEETMIILNHYKDKDLKKYIEIDNYFARNKIPYKVGDIK